MITIKFNVPRGTLLVIINFIDRFRIISREIILEKINRIVIHNLLTISRYIITDDDNSVVLKRKFISREIILLYKIMLYGNILIVQQIYRNLVRGGSQQPYRSLFVCTFFIGDIYE